MYDKHETFYFGNSVYSDFLESQPKADFIKYADWVKTLLPTRGKYLDVGCGTGVVFELMDRSGYDLRGIDISDTSIKIARSKGSNCVLYDGKKIPFSSNSFDVVGSLNVLEHVNNPCRFLGEMKRVAKKGGHIIIATPNFLSVTSSHHYHTRGLLTKTRNLQALLVKNATSSSKFDKMEVRRTEVFRPDDDAVNVTNPITILKWAKQNRLKVTYWSANWSHFPTSSKWLQSIKTLLDHGPLRAILGSVFIVLEK